MLSVEFATRHLCGDHCVHLAQRLEHAVVKVATIDERLDQVIFELFDH